MNYSIRNLYLMPTLHLYIFLLNPEVNTLFSTVISARDGI
jgi:hypothetical protein